MSEKEEIILTYYKIDTLPTIVYSHLKVNESTVGRFASYATQLQEQLTLFLNYIEASMEKVKDFFMENDIQDQYIKGLESVFNLSKESFLEKKITLEYDFYQISETKNISSTHYEKLKYILEVHQNIAKNLMEKELDGQRIEMISNYIKDIMIYLERDFALKDLPDAKKASIPLDSKHNTLTSDFLEATKISVQSDMSDTLTYNISIN